MNIEDTTPVLRIHVLGKLTHPLYPPLDGPSLWRLVSSLNLNAASLTSDEDGLRTLQDTLRLYSLRERGRAEHEIDGMVHMDVRRILRRFGADAWRGYRRGHEVLLDFDTSHYSGSSALMLASVLRHFLGLYSSVNTFAEVAVRRKGIAGEWKRWSPLAGAQELL
jgi:type VI secretion system protein ImpG